MIMYLFFGGLLVLAIVETVSFVKSIVRLKKSKSKKKEETITSE